MSSPVVGAAATSDRRHRGLGVGDGVVGVDHEAAAVVAVIGIDGAADHAVLGEVAGRQLAVMPMSAPFTFQLKTVV